MTDAERHLVHRLVAFFATGDSIVANNLVLNLYKHINAPEARLYLSRQLFEEAQHVEFYLTLLDTYVPDQDERFRAFAAIENIPSIQRKAEFCMRWLNSAYELESLETQEDRRQFLLNLICFAACIEGLFFFGAFAYVYFLRSRGLLHGLAGGTNWVFRDESAHMAFAFEVVNTVRREEPDLFDAGLEARGLRDDRRGHRLRDAVRRRPPRQGVAGLSVATCASTSSTAPTSASRRWGCRSATARRTPSPSWTCRTCRSWRTSSSAASPPTRWASRAR